MFWNIATSHFDNLKTESKLKMGLENEQSHSRSVQKKVTSDVTDLTKHSRLLFNVKSVHNTTTYILTAA